MLFQFESSGASHRWVAKVVYLCGIASRPAVSLFPNRAVQGDVSGCAGGIKGHFPFS